MKLRRILLWTIAAVVVFSVAVGLLVQSSWFKGRVFAYLAVRVQEEYALRLEAGAFDFLLSGGIHIRAGDVRLFGKDEATPFLTLRAVSAEAPYSILWSQATHIRRLDAAGVSLDLDRPPHFPKQAGGEGSLSIDRIVLKDGDLTMMRKHFTDLSFDAEMTPDRIDIRSASGGYRAATMQGSGAVLLTDPVSYNAEYTAAGDAALLADFISGLPVLAGLLQAHGTLEGKSADFHARIAFQAPTLRVEDTAAFPLKGEVEYASASAETPLNLQLRWKSLPMEVIHRLFPRSPLMSARSSGEFHYSGGSDFWHSRSFLQASLTETKGRLPVSGRVVANLAGGAITLEPSRITSRSVILDVAGVLNESRMQLKVNGRAGSAADLSELAPGLRRFPMAAAFNGTLAGPYAALRIEGILNSQSADGSVQLNGFYDFGSERFHSTFEGRATGVLISRLGAPGLDGQFRFEGNASGTVANPVLHGTLSGQDITYEGLRIGEAEAILNSDGKQLKASLQVPSYDAGISGTYTWKNAAFEADGSFEKLKIGSLRSWLPERIREASGEISGSVHISGNAKHWRDAGGWLQFEDSILALSGVELKVLHGSRIDLADGRLTVNANAQSLEGSLHLEGSAPLDSHAGMDLQAVADLDLAAARRLAPGWILSGRAQGAARITGTFEHPQVTGSIDVHGASAEDPQKRFHLRDTDGRIEFKPDRVEAVLHGMLNESPMQGSASIPLKDAAGKLEFSIHSVELASLLPDTPATGLVDLDVHAEGQGTDPAKWKGSAVLQTSDLALQDTALKMVAPAHIDLTNGVITVHPLQIHAAGLLDLDAKGAVDLVARTIHAEVSGRGDLSLVSGFVPDLQGNGPFDVNAEVTGSFLAPVFNGAIRMDGALLRVAGYPFALEQIHLDAPFDKDGLRVKSFSARLGGGTVEGAGELPLKDGKPGGFEFQVTGRNVGLNYPEGLRSQIDADLQLHGSIESPVLSGSIKVLRSQYREDIDYRERLVNTLLAQKEMLAPPSGATGRLKLDIAVKTWRDFRMHNNLARLQAGGDLRVTGTGAQPRISGQVRIREGGRILFEGNDLIVDHGVLTFNGTRELNPVFDVLLTTTVMAREADESPQEYRISIPLQGTLDQLSATEPSSDPPLQKFQIYSLLLTGQIGPFQQTAATVFQRQLAAYLSGKLFFDFEFRVAGALGLSRFEIVPPDLISSENDPSARVILGKEVAPGLNVQYSTLLSQHSTDTWIVDYRMKNRFSLLFVDQEDGSYTGGLRHNLRFGGTKSQRSGKVRGRGSRISRVDTTVESVLDKESILKALDLRVGEPYDPWKVDDLANKLKETLQKRGSLFPQLEITETTSGPEVVLQLTVSDRGLRSMEFAGMDVPSTNRAKYLKWWREGLSESTVVLQITDDLLLELHRQGYHRGRINTSQTDSPSGMVYHFLAVPGPQYLKAHVAFRGNTHYPSDRLMQDLSALYGSREGLIQDALHRFHSLSDRIQALYVRRGFLDAQIDPGPVTYTRGNPASVVREIRVREGQSWRIAEIEVSGGQTFPADLWRRLKLVPGSLYDSQSLTEDEVSLTDFYQDLGYRQVEVSTEVHRKAGEELVLSYRLETGSLARVAAVRITGNQRTRLNLIEKQIHLKPGDVMTPGSLIETQNRITSLQLFRQVRVEPRETETPGMYDVAISVREADPYNVTYGLRYDSELHLEGEVQFQDSNLFGTGRNALLYGRWNSTASVYRFILHSAPEAERPETLSLLPWRSLVSLSYEATEEPPFRTKQTSINFQRRWEPFGPLILLSNLKWEQGRVTSSTPGPIPFDIKQKIFRLIGIALLDERNDTLDPTRGFFVSNEVEYAPGFLNPDLSFAKNYTQYFQYFSIGPLVSASAVRVGVAGELIGSEHFFTGGQNTIRGFDLDEVGPHSRITGLPVGGEAMLVLNQEFRFPVYSWFGGVVFYDGGNVYPNLSDFSLNDLRHSAGFGLRLKSPYGIVRLDMGFNLFPQKGEPSYVLHVGLGQAW